MSSEVETRYQALVGKFRAREYRITPQRLAILRLLAESTDHPVGRIYQRLYDRFPTMSLATVYKTLAVLKEMGEVLELSLGEGENFGTMGITRFLIHTSSVRAAARSWIRMWFCTRT